MRTKRLWQKSAPPPRRRRGGGARVCSTQVLRLREREREREGEHIHARSLTGPSIAPPPLVHLKHEVSRSKKASRRRNMSSHHALLQGLLVLALFAAESQAGRATATATATAAADGGGGEIMFHIGARELRSQPACLTSNECVRERARVSPLLVACCATREKQRSPPPSRAAGRTPASGRRWSWWATCPAHLCA